MAFCECGCGEQVANRFVHNHHTRMLWHKAKARIGKQALYASVPTNLSDLDLYRYLFDLNPTTGVLTRRVGTGPSALVGSTVGTVDGKGYLHVSINGKFVRLHRIIFLMHYGYLPPEVDHKNRRRWENWVDNLRAAARKGNSGNSGPCLKNTSGFKGVSRNSRSGLWHAQIKIDGKQTHLGRCDTPEEAARLYDAAAKEHFGEFAWLNNA